MSPDFDLPENLNIDSLESFDLSREYVPDPVIPDGLYKGIITKVTNHSESKRIDIVVQLTGNDGKLCTDGITPVDNSTCRYTLWLPKIGDELIPSTFSSLTKRQDAIRAIKTFADNLGIKIKNEKDIEEAITMQTWISMPVLAKIKSRMYEDKIYNSIKTLLKQ